MGPGRIFGGKSNGGRVRHYFAGAFILIGVSLTATALVEVYFRYRDSWVHASELQEQVATAGALKIEQFIREIERDMLAATKTRDVVSHGLSGEYKWELRRLLANTPAVTHVIAYDLRGIARVQALRFGSEKNVPASPVLRSGESFFGPGRFTDEGPVISIAVPIERFAGKTIGVLLAVVDLKYVWEVIEGIKVGKGGNAYLVARAGDLIAHPDITRVLQRQDFGGLDQVEAAFSPGAGRPRPETLVSHNLEGTKVFSSYALIPGLDWAIFVERPIDEIYAPMYASLLRTSSVLIVGLGLALFAIFVVRGRVVRPLEILRQGVERISKGDLDSRVDIHTGDEFEILSDDFNKMAANLNEAYTDLEGKVIKRTQELEIANTRLEDASKHKSQFLANVNHELRTPLSAIIGYARLLQRETEGEISELQKENLDDLLQNAQRLLQMIDSLLELSKIEAGRMPVRKQPVNIDELLDWAISTVTPMLNHDRVRLVREIPPHLPIVDSDPDMLRQVILNLLGNALKFTDDGEIRIFARQQNGRLNLAVADTGIGISLEEVGEIFEEFQQGVMSRNREHAGTGLGLAIVKRFVGLLGGDVTVESEPGKGSTFTVTLPLDGAENMRV